MNRKLTIVTYHYVRDLERSRFPAIKGLSLARFRHQLDHIQANYTPITVEMLRDAVTDRDTLLPSNAILLTFDDGYSDHYLNVFPLLDQRGIQGCFFPPAMPILEHRVLDVNKIHFILASAPGPVRLLERVLSTLDEFRPHFELKPREAYLQPPLVGEHRFDSQEVVVLKRLLQRELPEPVREEIVHRLFAEYVTNDESAFACELYMSVEQIACLHRHGMHVGSHGYSHLWLNRVSPTKQAEDVDRSLRFLQQAGATDGNWTMCYPYGGFDESLLRVLQERGCRFGFTVEARIADLDRDHSLALPRLDTNDLAS